jgi:DNA gyrase subunit B
VTGVDSSKPRIEVLKGMVSVRTRPVMYIGSVGPRGLLNMLDGVLANAVEEVLAGRATRVDVEMHGDGSVSVTDDGAGIPVETDPSTGEAGVTLAFTTLSAGAQVLKRGPSLGHLNHSTPLVWINPLSDHCEVTVRREGRMYRQRFARGPCSRRCWTSVEPGAAEPRCAGDPIRRSSDILNWSRPR